MAIKYIGNLLILMYSAVKHPAKLIQAMQSGLPEGLHIDLADEQWTYRGQTYDIGTGGKIYPPAPYVVVGVFDSTKAGHLNAMLRTHAEMMRRD